jgi:hypothetical protein
MLDFVNPAGAGRWSLSGRGETRTKSVTDNDLGAIIDYNAQVLLVQKAIERIGA